MGRVAVVAEEVAACDTAAVVTVKAFGGSCGSAPVDAMIAVMAE